MQVIAVFVAVLGGLAFWWWRLQMIKEATDEVGDMAGRAWGKYKRHKFRKKVEDSPLEAVDDPAAAAAVMMLAIVKEEGPLTPEAEAAVRTEVTSSMRIADPTELLVFGKWVASHVEDANNVSLRYAKLWSAALDMDERKNLVAMVERVAMVTGGISPAQRMRIVKLRERLGLTG